MDLAHSVKLPADARDMILYGMGADTERVSDPLAIKSLRRENQAFALSLAQDGLPIAIGRGTYGRTFKTLLGDIAELH